MAKQDDILRGLSHLLDKAKKGEDPIKWTFPLSLSLVGSTSKLDSFKKLDWQRQVEVPVGKHPGAWGVSREKDKHRGVDLYASPGTEVVSVEDGKVVDVFDVPAPEDAPSGKTTRAVSVEGSSGRVTYAEIEVDPKISVGTSVKEGQRIGTVVPVHDEDSDIPNSMLHLQLTTSGTTPEWTGSKPKNLLDPTQLLLDDEAVKDLICGLDCVLKAKKGKPGEIRFWDSAKSPTNPQGAVQRQPDPPKVEGMPPPKEEDLWVDVKGSSKKKSTKEQEGQRWKLNDEQIQMLDTKPAKAGIEVIDGLKKAGHEAYLVGGAVRDILLGKKPKDFDVVTSARPKDVEAAFPGKTYDVGKEFAITPVLVDGEWIEVATFRTESGYSDNRRPDEVKYSDSADEDAKRRDFTINGLYLDPTSKEVVDSVGGVKDIKEKVVRSIGNPEDRFNEDALRLMRAVRFASTLGFGIEKKTAEAIKKLAPNIDKVSRERVHDELVKMLTKGGAAEGIHIMEQSGLIRALPEVAALRGIEQSPKWHPEGDALSHTIAVLEQLDKEDNPSPALAMAALLHDIGKVKDTKVLEDGKITSKGHEATSAELADKVMRDLKFDRKTRERTVDLIRDHMIVHRIPEMSKKKRIRLFMQPHFEELLELGKLDKLGRGTASERVVYDQVKKLYEEFKEDREQYQEPLIQGRDLIDMGFEAGPYFGQILQEVRDAQLEGKLKDAEEAKKFVLERFKGEKDLLAGAEYVLKFKNRISRIDPPDPVGSQGQKRTTFRITFPDGKTDYIDKLPTGAKPGAVFDTDSGKVVSEPEIKADSPQALWEEKGVHSPYFKKWFGDWEKDPKNSSKVVDDEGKPAVVYHGTTNIFDAFDTKVTNIENDFGKGAYFTNSEDDVGVNYAGEGPDLTSRIDRLAERIESEEDISYDEAKKKAKKRLTKHSGTVIPAYLSIKKPFVVGGDDETQLTYEYGPNEDDIEHFMEDAKEQLMEENSVEESDDSSEYFDDDDVRDRAREIAMENGYEDESGTLVEFVEALRDAASEYSDVEISTAIGDLMGQAEDGISARDAVAALKQSEGLMYATDDEGDLASSEIIREALENMGFDGVIDRSVNEKFGSEKKVGKPMEGMSSDTTHYIAFQPNQVKSSIGNKGTFDPDDPRMVKDVFDGLDWLIRKREKRAKVIVNKEPEEGEGVQDLLTGLNVVLDRRNKDDNK